MPKAPRRRAPTIQDIADIRAALDRAQDIARAHGDDCRLRRKVSASLLAALEIYTAARHGILKFRADAFLAVEVKIGLVQKKNDTRRRSKHRSVLLRCQSND